MADTLQFIEHRQPVASTSRRIRRAPLDDMDLDDAGSESIAVPGESIASARDWMRGHGTHLDEASQSVLAGVAGRVERVNKLVSVKALRGRYKPEVGDLVVGRVMEVQAKRWKVDIGARLDAVLMLSSINLPGGVQRRKLESDELQMRNYFAEGDLLVCEVQAFFQDGSVSLHTRSLKYGKLRNGQFVKTSAILMPRLKSHFITLPNGVELIAGLNGYIWVGAASVEATDVEEKERDLYANRTDSMSDEQRENMARVAATIQLLAAQGLSLTEQRINAAWEASVDGDEGDSIPVHALVYSQTSQQHIVDAVNVNAIND